MKVTLHFSKVEKITEMCSSLYHSQYVSIRYLASVIGTVVSSFPAVKFGPLHYRSLECDKIEALTFSKGNFDSYVYIYLRQHVRSEKSYHVTVLELKAILFGLLSLIKVHNTHIKILTDNMNAAHITKNMGSCRSLSCTDLVKRISSWTIQNNNWLSISYIPGVENPVVDAESRQYELRTESYIFQQLNPSIFRFIVRKLTIK